MSEAIVFGLGLMRKLVGIGMKRLRRIFWTRVNETELIQYRVRI